MTRLVESLLSLSPGVPLSLLSVPTVKTLRLKKLVDFGSGQTSYNFLGHSVGRRLAVPGNMVFISFHSFETGSTTDEFVGELGLVGLVVRIEVVDLVSPGRIVVEEVKEAHCDRCLRCQVVKKRKRSLLLKNKRIKKGDKVGFI